MERKVVLCGKSCSGKDTLALLLQEFGLRKPVSHTSRPKRDYEVDGKDYYFITKEEFEKLTSEGFFQEYDWFNGWGYALSKEEFAKAQVFIQTPRGLEQIIQQIPREQLLIIYIDIPAKLRKSRNDERHDTHDSIERRWVSDDIDFENMEQWGSPWDLKVSIQDTNALTDFVKLIANSVNPFMKGLPKEVSEISIDFKFTDTELSGEAQVMENWRNIKNAFVG